MLLVYLAPAQPWPAAQRLSGLGPGHLWSPVLLVPGIWNQYRPTSILYVIIMRDHTLLLLSLFLFFSQTLIWFWYLIEGTPFLWKLITPNCHFVPQGVVGRAILLAVRLWIHRSVFYTSPTELRAIHSSLVPLNILHPASAHLRGQVHVNAYPLYKNGVTAYLGRFIHSPDPSRSLARRGYRMGAIYQPLL